MMNQQTPSRTTVVYRRTTKGQAAAMPSAPDTLAGEQRRLLLLVNGFTTLDVLAQVGHFADGPEEMARTLQSSGLIEEAGEARQEAFMRSPWRSPPNQ